MTKPMYCPMSFMRWQPETSRKDANSVNIYTPMECTPDCAWAVIRDGEYMCSIPYYSVPNDKRINSRPLEGDAE